MEEVYLNIRKNINIHTLYDSVRAAIKFWSGRRPLRRATTQILPPPFFIIGSGRSGNTLLRAVLTGHSDVAIPPESYVLAKAIRRFRAYSFLDWPLLVRIVLAEFEYHDQFESWDLSLRSVYEPLSQLPEEKCDLALILDEIYRRYMSVHMPNAKRWGDKTPMNTAHLHWIDRVFPQAKYVHMLRDGRDVVSSYVQAGLYSSVEEAGQRWRRSVTMARRFGERFPDRYLEVRYENLVRRPEREVRRVCEFLGIEFRKDMLQFQDDVDELGDTHLSHHEGLRRPINTDSIGKWKSRLSTQDQEIVVRLIGDKLDAMGYEACA